VAGDPDYVHLREHFRAVLPWIAPEGGALCPRAWAIAHGCEAPNLVGHDARREINAAIRPREDRVKELEARSRGGGETTLGDVGGLPWR